MCCARKIFRQLNGRKTFLFCLAECHHPTGLLLANSDRLYAKTDMIFTKQECSVEKKETDWSILRLGFVNDYQGPKSGLGSIWETGRGEKHSPRWY